MKNIKIKEADKVEIISLVDNYTDLLVYDNTNVVRRHWTNPKKGAKGILRAEHGLSFVVKAYSGAKAQSCIFDAGLTDNCLLHNAELLGVNLNEIVTAVLSHGHRDHFYGFKKFFETIKRRIPLLVHPDAFLERRINIPSEETKRVLPLLDENELTGAGADLYKIEEPYLFGEDMTLALGEVRRVTDFEKGFPYAEAKISGDWMVDPLRDDQGLVLKLKDKGLIVIGGCSHAGVINTVKYAQEVTGTDKVHAVIGGFHLTGAVFEPIIEKTIEEMKKIAPDIVVPMHCTGGKPLIDSRKKCLTSLFLMSLGLRILSNNPKIDFIREQGGDFPFVGMIHVRFARFNPLWS